MTNQQRRRRQRRRALLAHPLKTPACRPRHGDDLMGRPELPPPTRRMVRLGIDRASMAQGGKP